MKNQLRNHIIKNISLFEFDDKTQKKNFIKDIDSHLEIKMQKLIKKVNSFKDLNTSKYSQQRLNRIIRKKAEDFMSGEFIKSDNQFIENIMSGYSASFFTNYAQGFINEQNRKTTKKEFASQLKAKFKEQRKMFRLQQKRAKRKFKPKQGGL